MMGHIGRPGRHFEMTSLNRLLAMLQLNAVDYVEDYLDGRAAGWLASLIDFSINICIAREIFV